MAGLGPVFHIAGACGTKILIQTNKMPPQQSREIDLLRREIFRVMSTLPDSAARLALWETFLRTQLELEDGSELQEGKLRMIYESIL